MKILIGGGGTGGHIYPALALARHAMAEDSSTNILFIGSAAGLESKIVPSAGFPLKTIPARGFQRSFKQVGSLIRDLIGGLRQSGIIIKEFQPNVVLGTGGYVAAPMVLAALLKRYPAVIHEQNALPGLANRLLAPLVKKVCLSFAETEKKMPPFSRVVYTGNPRASEVTALSREEGCRYFGFDPLRKTILIYGGSRGALKLNRVVTAYIKENLFPENVNLIYVTGEIYFKEVAEELGSLPEGIRLYPYLDQMPEALAAADLAVTRSGATTLAELTALGLPALLVPSPNVVNNHQYFNARLLADAGAAVLIDENDFDAKRLQLEANRLLEEPLLLEEMSRCSRQMGVPDAAAKLYRCLQEVAS
jgi:UDP-N-acetylglucosamine--N-acetylmuramyl-(pentapeptide) pyrophosphoryl-undecaprenol N-acetylglucosamine transferase